MCCEDTDVCRERVLVHFGARHTALWKIGPAHPNQSRSHCLALGTRTRTDTPWGLAGFDIIGVAPKIVARRVAKGANTMWISSAFRYPGHRFMRRENTQGLLGDSAQNVL